ncbi:hypothetical protein PtA15_13A205 [Puccinia triticina]|uniref:Uncharacterized protein n=1 Tax=Puccinia triticina TaxID=208348 RepID=A0ABY7D396_9BASI|nr:uncharacterized protein PtA15_13A205 [Puccinia triticina]WAQ90806.1 hypothetical protein PtA15_13A205 [Puccinia triticina]WAR60992.1 hypothetical protein PtB15_13B243 [Puccinia triticina]
MRPSTQQRQPLIDGETDWFSSKADGRGSDRSGRPISAADAGWTRMVMADDEGVAMAAATSPGRPAA